MGLLPSQIPFAFNRANGGIYGGTATPNGASTASSASGTTQNTNTAPLPLFEEMDNSPTLDLGEQATVVKVFKIDPIQAQTAETIYFRGQTFPDSNGNLFKILNVRFEYQKGDYYLMYVTSEGINVYIPPSEFDIQEVDINPAAQKHPRYAPLNQVFYTTASGGNPAVPSKFNPIATVLLAVNQLQNSPVGQSITALPILNDVTNFATQAHPSGDVVAQGAALELLKKLWRGEDTFSLGGYRISYSTFGYTPFDLDPGGRVEDPVANSLIDPFFTQDIDGNDIFTNLTATKSPQFFERGVTFLRQPDTQTYQRTWFRRTQTWLMAPAGGSITLFGNNYYWTGQWDLQWYTPLSPNNPGYPPYDTYLTVA